jgi:hypothetical protein
MRHPPMRCTPIRYTSIRCTLMRYTPLRYTIIRCTIIRCTRYTPMCVYMWDFDFPKSKTFLGKGPYPPADTCKSAGLPVWAI